MHEANVFEVSSEIPSGSRAIFICFRLLAVAALLAAVLGAALAR